MEKLTKEEKDYIVECQKKMTSFLKQVYKDPIKRRLIFQKAYENAINFKDNNKESMET
jgi:hypothetical protein